MFYLEQKEAPKSKTTAHKPNILMSLKNILQTIVTAGNTCHQVNALEMS